jgi:hemolysin activation/secretion protein
VVILPQQIEGKARAKLRVIDGFIERIDAGAVPEHVRERAAAVVMPLLYEHHLTQGELERQLLIAGETAGLDLSSTFAAGKEVGGSLLVLSGKYRPVSASIYADNAMPAVFGTGQIVTTASLNSPSGQGDQLTVSAAGLPDRDWGSRNPTRRYLSGTYMVPIGIHGWFFELYATDGRTTPRVDPSLATQGLFQQAHVKLSYEVLKRRDYELTLNGRFEATDEMNSELVTNPALPLSLDRLRVLRVGADGIWRWRESGTTWTYGGNYSRGLDAFGARSAADATPLLPLSRQGADDVFDKVDGHAEVNQALPNDFFADIAASAQYSFNHALLSAEQFDITGAKALSGFTAGELIGDRGYVARGELGRPFTQPIMEAGSVTITPYLFLADGERDLELPTARELGSIRAINFGGSARYNFTPARDDLPSSYGFIEWSRERSTDATLDAYLPGMP